MRSESFHGAVPEIRALFTSVGSVGSSMTASIVSAEALRTVVAGARDVQLGSFDLAPGQRIVGSLEAAAARGARVEVSLDGDMSWLPHATADSLQGGNQAVADDLRRLGADVRFAGPREMLHIKAAVVDGVTYLDDRNWAADDRQTILRIDDPAAAAAVRGALRGAPPAAFGATDLAVTKLGALALELAVANRPEARRLDVETESFGSGPIADALVARAAAGLPTRLLVSNDASERGGPDEATALAAARAAGVDVHVGGSREKLCLAGDVAWTGSANATQTGSHAADWGYVARERPLVDDLRSAFERNWKSSKPWIPAVAATSADGRAPLPGTAPVAMLRPSAA